MYRCHLVALCLVPFLSPALLPAAAPPLPEKQVLVLPRPATGCVVGTRLYTCRVYRRSLPMVDNGTEPGEWHVLPQLCNWALMHKEERGPELLCLPRGVERPSSFRWRVGEGCL